MPRRGDSAGKACGTSYLFPLHYSLKTFPFPHGFVLWWSANCESLSHGEGHRGLPGRASSLWQGSPWGAATKPPLRKGGASACRGGGIPWPRPRNLFTIHYSLFTKKPFPFHTGWYFGGVPTVNPSVTAAPCQLPLAREPLVQVFGFSLLRTHIISLSKYQPSIYS